MSRSVFRVLSDPELISRRSQAHAGQMIDGIAIGGMKWIPQTPALVIRLELDDIDANQSRWREREVDDLPQLIYPGTAVVLQVEPYQGLSGHDHEGSLGRAEAGVFVGDDVAERHLGSDQLSNRLKPLEDGGFIDSGAPRNEESAPERPM